MNFIEKHTRTKDEIKYNFLAFLSSNSRHRHLATKKLKEIAQIPREIVREYGKRFKYLLTQNIMQY